jgi:DNA invertase Pin-like site-specific DNA recombinase
MKDTIALTYRRVSTFKQEREGTSLDDQLRTCREYVRRHGGWQLGTEYCDVLTGRTAKRQDYQALLEECRQLRKAGNAVVVVTAALDRMGRDLLESVRSRKELRELDVELHCIREGGVLDETHANLLATMAQDESDRTSKRVRASKKYTIERGFRAVGRVPWGYRLDDATDEERRLGSQRRVLRVDEMTAPHVRELFRRAAERISIRQLTAWVASLPTDARGGRSLDYQKVRDRLSAPVYVARPDRPKDVRVLDRPVGNWPPLVSDEVWARVEAGITSHAKIPRQGRTWLLNGLIRCPKDGLRMQGRNERWGPIYRCGIPFKGCYFYAKLDVIDAAVLGEVGHLLEPLTANPGIRARLRAAWMQLQAPDHKGDDRRARALEQTVERSRKRRNAVMDLLVDGTIDRSEYDIAVGRYTVEIEAAERELAQIQDAATPTPLPSWDVVLRDLHDWQAALAGLDLAARRDVLGALVERVGPERVGRGQYAVKMEWTPLGKALRQLSEALPVERSTAVAAG